jgi:hypothetical protein
LTPGISEDVIDSAYSSEKVLTNIKLRLIDCDKRGLSPGETVERVVREVLSECD